MFTNAIRWAAHRWNHLCYMSGYGDGYGQGHFDGYADYVMQGIDPAGNRDDEYEETDRMIERGFDLDDEIPF